MFDDDTVTFQLAVMLRTMDIGLSVDHSVKLEEEGYILTDINQAVVDGLITQQDELLEEITHNRRLNAYLEADVEERKDFIAGLVFDYENFTDRLVEFTS